MQSYLRRGSSFSYSHSTLFSSQLDFHGDLHNLRAKPRANSIQRSYELRYHRHIASSFFFFFFLYRFSGIQFHCDGTNSRVSEQEVRRRKVEDFDRAELFINDENAISLKMNRSPSITTAKETLGFVESYLRIEFSGRLHRKHLVYFVAA